MEGDVLPLPRPPGVEEKVVALGALLRGVTCCMQGPVLEESVSTGSGSYVYMFRGWLQEKASYGGG